MFKILISKKIRLLFKKKNMLRTKLLFTIFILIATLGFTARVTKSDDIVGTWLTSSTNSKIIIFKTGNYFYGKISWLRNELNEQGKIKVDDKNPDTALRSRHILGLLLLKGFEYDEKNNEWVNGEIYDPKSGKTYSCKMKLTNNNTLEVHGFIGISLIGKTEIWTRSE